MADPSVHATPHNPPNVSTDKADGTPGEKKTFDAVVAACDVPGIQKLLPESFRKIKEVRCVQSESCAMVGLVVVVVVAGVGWFVGCLVVLRCFCSVR